MGNSFDIPSNQLGAAPLWRDTVVAVYGLLVARAVKAVAKLADSMHKPLEKFSWIVSCISSTRRIMSAGMPRSSWISHEGTDVGERYGSV